MSFTLMRYKNGRPAPITMSIWDAFKGTPPSKPSKVKPVSVDQPVIAHAVVEQPVVTGGPSSQIPGVAAIQVNVPVKCPCCKKVHSAGKQETKSDEAKDAENDKSEDKKSQKGDKSDGTNKTGGEEQKSKEGNAYSDKGQETYSKQDDKKIIEMKQQNKDWQEIMDAIGKTSKSQIKDHWKTIDPAKAGKDVEKSGANSKNDEKDKQNDSQGKKEQKQEGGKKGGGKDTSKKDDAGKTEEGELKSWSDRYDRQKWVAAASRHFDLTGQRITPAMAKKIAEGK